MDPGAAALAARTAPPAGRHLGPAEVLAVAGRRVHLALPEGRAWAVMATAQAYEPVAGDTVLAIGEGGAWYVIGIIEGTGRTTVTVPGDLTFHAPRGAITLKAGRGLRLEGAVVRILGERLVLAAGRLAERFETVRRHVRGLVDTRAGEARLMVEGDLRLSARRIAARAAEDVRLDGEQIKLG
jgi:hypothetical protein